MSSTYRHTQPGMVTLASVGAATVLVLVLTVLADVPAERMVLAGVAAVFALLTVLFASLRVTVEHAAVEVRFGPGLIGRRVPLSDVRSARAVRNRWWYGWGIRGVPRGWMFNVSGFDAVELELVSDRVFRIGTDEPEALLEALARAGVARA